MPEETGEPFAVGVKTVITALAAPFKATVADGLKVSEVFVFGGGVAERIGIKSAMEAALESFQNYISKFQSILPDMLGLHQAQDRSLMLRTSSGIDNTLWRFF